MQVLLMAGLVAQLNAGQPAPCPEAAVCFGRLEDRQHLVLLQPGSIAPGKYSRSSGLEMEALYLFEDQTFLYLQGTDGAEPVVYDKGRWRQRRGVLELHRDADVTWTPSEHTRYVAVRRWNVATELLLAGVDPEGRSMGHLKRVAAWEPGESKTTRLRLMRDCWRPAFYRPSK